MHSEQGVSEGPGPARGWRYYLLWLSGLWILLPGWVALRLLPASVPVVFLVFLLLVLAPAPGMWVAKRRQDRLRHTGKDAREEVERLKLELQSVRYRTGLLREELLAADRQARLSHHLTLLGQFTAGFLHEFNNPLAIVTGRLEVLLEERAGDADLCDDLRSMLKEAHYMANIAGTLLRALRRERGSEPFEPSVPPDVLADVLAALRPSAERQGIRILLETPAVPRVNLPAHVVNEVVRGLITNALQALQGRAGGTIWVRLEPYGSAGSRVVLKVEDDGPGVPESFREHLFEPFASQDTGRERLGLGLFLAASLLDTYDAALSYQPRDGGGASFVVRMPPARFTRGQPYHWFVKVPE